VVPCLSLAEAVPPAATNGTAKIQFASTVFDFEKVVGGQSVKHDFYFTNVGSSVLKITSVNAACGCTTAGEWTREVAPGAAGSIPLQFNSGNFSGGVTKTATVGCNDPASPTVILQIKGTVWRPIEVTPSMAMLHVNSELVSNATAVVRITNHAPDPVAVFEPVSSNPQFTAEVRTNGAGKLFEVVVRTVPPLNIANPHGTITLKTSLTNMPVITISAMSVVQPPISVNPPRVIVQSALLASNWTSKVTLRNGMNRPLQLSDAAINVPGATAELRETEPGRAFEVTLVVPPAARDASAPALTLKSNFADHQAVHVPIQVIGPNSAVTAQGIPLTARASRFLNSPEGRRALEPKPEDYLSEESGAKEQPATEPSPATPK
jgi:hypothetical protein